MYQEEFSGKVSILNWVPLQYGLMMAKKRVCPYLIKKSVR